MKKFLAAFVLTAMIIPVLSHAANDKPHFIIYKGKLTDGVGTPITKLTSLRFSLWKTADAMPMDLNTDGSFNEDSENTVYWYEQFLVTPDEEGNFVLALGSIVENRFQDHMFMQIDMKEMNGEFEIMDMFSDPLLDRQSVAFLKEQKVNLFNEKKTFRLEQDLTNPAPIKTLAMGDVLNNALDMNMDTKEITLNPKKKIYGSFIADEYCNAVYDACFKPGEAPAEEEKAKPTFASMLQATLFSPSTFSATPEKKTEPVLAPAAMNKTNKDLLNTIKILQQLILSLNKRIEELETK